MICLAHLRTWQMSSYATNLLNKLYNDNKYEIQAHEQGRRQREDELTLWGFEASPKIINLSYYCDAM